MKKDKQKQPILCSAKKLPDIIKNIMSSIEDDIQKSEDIDKETTIIKKYTTDEDEFNLTSPIRIAHMDYNMVKPMMFLEVDENNITQLDYTAHSVVLAGNYTDRMFNSLQKLPAPTTEKELDAYGNIKHCTDSILNKSLLYRSRYLVGLATFDILNIIYCALKKYTDNVNLELDTVLDMGIIVEDLLSHHKRLIDTISYDIYNIYRFNVSEQIIGNTDHNILVDQYITTGIMASAHKIAESACLLVADLCFEVLSKMFITVPNSVYYIEEVTPQFTDILNTYHESIYSVTTQVFEEQLHHSIPLPSALDTNMQIDNE